MLATCQEVPVHTLVWLTLTTAMAWDPLPVALDPIPFMPGTQPGTGVLLERSQNCLECHEGFDRASSPGFGWKGSMMGQAARDPLFWASMAVAAQDGIWAVGRPNIADTCVRCHFPSGWVEGRNEPANASSFVGQDFDGVTCDSCHKMVDPFGAERLARESSDLAGYWDEAQQTFPGSAALAADTRTRDGQLLGSLQTFAGIPMYQAGLPVQAGYTEASGGQFVVDSEISKRGPMADSAARHDVLYSRFHKSREFCASCHDVSNVMLPHAPFADAERGDGVTVLPSESQAAHALPHVERTWSEFVLSDFGLPGGALGSGPFAPGQLDTSRPGDAIATCQDCHMADRTGRGAGVFGAPVRPTHSDEHPQSGVPSHRIAGGNAWIPWILASTDPRSPNFDPVNAALLGQGPSVLTLDLNAGVGIDAESLLVTHDTALGMLRDAATIEQLAYDPVLGTLDFRVVNHTAHKLISGYAEGRRMFAQVQLWDGDVLLEAINPYDGAVGTLRGLPVDGGPAAPPLRPWERYEDDLVYEVRGSASTTGEDRSFHFVLTDGVFKDNRIPPRGFRIAEASDRGAEPYAQGQAAPGWFTPDEYAGGYDDVSLDVVPGADRVVVRLAYQTTSREYVAFLHDELEGLGGTLTSPTPSGEPEAYIAQDDPWFDRLAAWGTTIWDLWEHNKGVPGAAPVAMAGATWGCVPSPEVCNGVDDDCDGLVDDEDDDIVDLDFDGAPACGDCDDGDAEVNPRYLELPGDGIDQTCDGRELCFLDADGDGSRSVVGTSLAAGMDCAASGLLDLSAPRDCWDAVPWLNRTDVDGDGYGTCDADCDDGDAAVQGCTGKLWLHGAEPAVSGVLTSFEARGATSGRTVWLMGGTPAPATPVPGCPGVKTWLASPFLVGTRSAGGSGTVFFDVTPPDGLAGRVYGFQVFEPSTCRISTPIARTFE